MLNIRAANMDDALDILAWRNDPISRQMSRDRDVIAEAIHIKWFAAALSRQDRVFFIGEVGPEKVGMMRFDRIDEDTWEVSHNMAPSARGRGFGQAMVRAVLDQFHCPKIIAEIREDNPVCWHIYEKAGFEFQHSDGTSRHYALSRAGGISEPNHQSTEHTQ